uniref:Uncharacterized protein n=1 Tax=Leersia perrieri TaxID=77586 RepID=A0A0D9XZ28_9ORYZ
MTPSCCYNGEKHARSQLCCANPSLRQWWAATRGSAVSEVAAGAVGRGLLLELTPHKLAMCPSPSISSPSHTTLLGLFLFARIRGLYMTLAEGSELHTQ